MLAIKVELKGRLILPDVWDYSTAIVRSFSMRSHNPIELGTAIDVKEIDEDDIEVLIRI